MIAVINVTQFSIRHSVLQLRPKWNLRCVLHLYCPFFLITRIGKWKEIIPRLHHQTHFYAACFKCTSYQCKWHQYLTLLPFKSDCQITTKLVEKSGLIYSVSIEWISMSCKRNDVNCEWKWTRLRFAFSFIDIIFHLRDCVFDACSENVSFGLSISK